MWLSVIKMWQSCLPLKLAPGQRLCILGVERSTVKDMWGIWQTSRPLRAQLLPASNLLIPRRCSSLGLSPDVRLGWRNRKRKKKNTPSHATPLSPVWQSFHCSVKKPSRTRSCSKRSTAWMQSLQRSRQLGKLANGFLVFNWICVFFVLWTRVELSRISARQTSAVLVIDKPPSHFVPQLFYLLVTDQGFSER